MKYILILALTISTMFASKELSLLKDKKNVYFHYVKDLIKEKGYSKKKIQGILASKKRTVTGNLLKALNYDYIKMDSNKADFYYDEIVRKVRHKIKNTTESIYIADYLLKKEKYDIIPEILSREYCESLLSYKEKECFYYLYIAKNKLSKENKLEERILKKKYPKLYKKIEESKK